MTSRKPAPGVFKPPPRSRMKPPPRSTMKPPPNGLVPNPRRPRLVPDIHGNELMDLFVFFPDLPRPARPRARVPLRRIVVR